MTQSVHASQSTTTITVNRTTIIYPNYAISVDTIKVINGSLTSVIAEFPTNTTILNISGPDISYAYQLSYSPAREVIVFKNSLTADEATTIKYVYTGFISSGQLQIGFQPAYSTYSVNDTASYYYGVQNWGVTLQIFYHNNYLNISQGEKFTFNGTTAPYTFITATNPPTTTMPTLYQAYLQTLDRHIAYANGIFYIQDDATFVWASPSESNQLYLFLPNIIINKSISISYFYGNVTSTLKHTSYGEYSLLEINSPIELTEGQMVGLQIDYSIKGQSLNLSSIGFYGMFCEACSIIASGIKPLSGSWTSMPNAYFAGFRDVTGAQLNEYSINGVATVNFSDGSSLAVLIIGVVAVVSSYTYAQRRTRKETKRSVPQKLIANLSSASSSIDLAYSTIKKFLDGGVRAPVATNALTTFEDLQRKLLKDISEGLSRGELDNDYAKKLTESLSQIRDSLADLVDLQVQFNQKKIRQNVYMDLKLKYQRNLQRAISAFRDTVNDLKQL
jgi:hypothetical protein